MSEKLTKDPLWTREDLRSLCQDVYYEMSGAQDTLEVKRCEAMLKAIRTWSELEKEDRGPQELEEYRRLVERTGKNRKAVRGGASVRGTREAEAADAAERAPWRQ